MQATPAAVALFGLAAGGTRRGIVRPVRGHGRRPALVVTPGEAEATRFAEDANNTLGVSAAVYPPRDFVRRNIERTKAGSTSTAA